MDLKFNDITLESKELIESYTKPFNCPNAEISFAHIYIWSSNSQIQFAEYENSLFFKLDFPGEVPFLWAPIPGKACIDYKKILDIAFDYLISIGVKPYLRAVSDPFYTMIKDVYPSLLFKESINNFDYIYLSEDLITLKGKKFHGKRNHINRFMMLYPDFEYAPLTNEMAKDCCGLYKEWLKSHNEDSIIQYDEPDSVKRALTNLDALNLTGGVLKIDGKIKAFTIGERILPDMHQIHIEKAANDIDGLYPVINREYASHNCSDVKYINREEDMGLEGLRAAKHSYRPVMMIKKYNICCCEKCPDKDICKQI
ncbi:MAG: phosphatidylglycerol lysyltransferase domain-containing protein [Lachnospiraceae bacterium]|nr:phosphatidylglycerol lysyltransferase domain-containing protein [Lachnospiraceae bacterium]